MNPRRRILRRLARLDWHRFAVAALLVWAVGIGVAAMRLDAWSSELSRTLVQLAADAQFRTRLAQYRDAVDPEWYRRKALSLLAANEKLRSDAAWTLFVPGSWQLFDDLEERLAARIEREFADIVVETIRRELYARAARLTGARPAEGGNSAMDAVRGCAAPMPNAASRRLSAAPEDLPEYLAVQDYLRELERFDQAVQAFLALQQSGARDAELLRQLVRYTLDAELTGPLARSSRMFRSAEEVPLQPALMRSAMQWAARCSLLKGMEALYTRLLASNELLALEEALAQQSHGLFDGTRALPFDRAVERYRSVAALLQDQEILLGQGRNGWMRQASLRLGSGHAELLERIRRNGLLGTEVLAQLEARAGAAFAQFRRQFEARFGSAGQPGIVWLEPQQRFSLAPERIALRAGLSALLQQPFMQEQAAPRKEPANAASGKSLGLEEATAWMESRERFVRDTLPLFPAFAQPSVARMADARLADLVYQRAYRAIKAAEPPEAAALDAAAYRRQGAKVALVQATLDRLGARGLSARLAALHAEPLLKRLAALQLQSEQLALYQPAAGNFAWWHGEPAPLWQALGAADGAAMQRTLADQVTRLEALQRQAAPLLAAAPALAEHPQVQAWQELATELERWRTRHADSSLLALERYLLALGAELRRDNCVEKLAMQSPPRHGNQIAQRYLQLHEALLHRCANLRSDTPAAAYAPQ